MLTRNDALALLEAAGVTGSLLQHCMASESVMRGLAGKLGGDPGTWGLAGLLHDLDWPVTESNPSRHGLDAADALEGKLPPEAVQAIRAHAGEMNGTPAETLLDKALRCGETVTGLVTAAAYVRPTGIAGMEVKSLKKKLKDKAFAAGVNRDIVRSCTDLGLTLEDFLAIAIAEMTKDADALGLVK